MKTELTKRLLGHLIRKGYKYYLSKNSPRRLHSTSNSILLRFVKNHPNAHKLPKPYEGYNNNMLEPLKMASGVAGTLITVDLSATQLKSYNAAFPIPE